MYLLVSVSFGCVRNRLASKPTYKIDADCLKRVMLLLNVLVDVLQYVLRCFSLRDLVRLYGVIRRKQNGSLPHLMI